MVMKSFYNSVFVWLPDDRQGGGLEWTDAVLNLLPWEWALVPGGARFTTDDMYGML